MPLKWVNSCEFIVFKSKQFHNLCPKNEYYISAGLIYMHSTDEKEEEPTLALCKCYALESMSVSLCN